MSSYVVSLIPRFLSASGMFGFRPTSERGQQHILIGEALDASRLLIAGLLATDVVAEDVPMVRFVCTVLSSVAEETARDHP